MENNLIEIISGVKNGDESAFETLYSEYAKQVYFLALKIVGSRENAEEIAQDVFLYIYQKISELRDPQAFPAWLSKITTSKCTDFLRKNNPFTTEIEVIAEIEFIEETDRSLIPDKSLDNLETARIIIDIIDKLPLPQKVCVYYYYYENLSVAEIAEQLAVLETTVRNRLALARDKIKKALEELEDKEGLKLYVAFPLILIPLLRKAAENTEVPQGILANITDGIASIAEAAADGIATVTEVAADGIATITETATAGAATTTTTATAGTATTTTTATAGTAATTTISIKAAVGIVAGIIAVCGICAGIIISNLNNEPNFVPEPRNPDRDVPAMADVNGDIELADPNEPQPEPYEPEAQSEQNVVSERIEIDLSGQGITDEILAQYVADETIPHDVTRLDLGGNQITDISPLVELTNLMDLGLWSNQITNITPLRELTNLTKLSLWDNQIADITPLSELTKLTSLLLLNNQITDISALSGLINLTELWLDENQITDISILSGLTNLRSLRLGSNQITDISALSELTDLAYLIFHDNQINNIVPLSRLTKLTTLGFNRNQVTDITPLSELTDLTWLSLTNNQIADISALSRMINLRVLYLNNNQITDISALNGMSNHISLHLLDNSITDWSPVFHIINVNGRPRNWQE
jgi:RNA polymerase sigma factor (sigma-70 family)